MQRERRGGGEKRRIVQIIQPSHTMYMIGSRKPKRKKGRTNTAGQEMKKNRDKMLWVGIEGIKRQRENELRKEIKRETVILGEYFATKTKQKDSHGRA